MKNKAKLMFLLLCISQLAFSMNVEWMKGYIVTNSSDTIRGEVAFREGEGDWKECFFRRSEKAGNEIYSPDDILAYGYDSGLSFLSKEVKLFKVHQKVFVQSLLLGMMDLYYLEIAKCVEFPDGYAAYVVKRPSGKMLELLDPGKSDKRSIVKWQNQVKLDLLFSDYPQLQKKAKKIDANRDQWINLFKEYNETICDNYVCTYYQEKEVSTRWFLTPSVAINYNTIGFNDFQDQKSLFPTIGIIVSRSLSKFSDRNLLNIGLEITKNQVSISEKYMKQISDGYTDPETDLYTPPNYKEYTADADFSSLAVMNYFSYEYRLMQYKVAPLLELGFYHSLQFPLKNKIEGYFVPDVNCRIYSCGYLIGTGMVVKTKKHSMPIKLQYRNLFFGSKKSRLATLERINTVTLSVGYTFGL